MPKKKRKSSKKGFSNILKDERTWKISGLLCLFLALYLVIAFVSYFFTWSTDQDKVLQHSWSILLESGISVDNWLGRLGAIVSNSFFYWGFGLSSFGVVLILGRLGLAMIKQTPLIEVVKFATYTVLAMAMLSIVFEFLLYSSTFSWGGVMGETIFIWMTNFVGRLGLFLFIIMILGFTTVWFLNPQLNPSMAGASMPFGKFNLPSLDFFHAGAELAEPTTQKAPKKAPKKARGYLGKLEEEMNEMEVTNDSEVVEASDVSPLNNPSAFPDFDMEVENLPVEKKKKKKETPKVLKDLMLDLVNPTQIKESFSGSTLKAPTAEAAPAAETQATPGVSGVEVSVPINTTPAAKMPIPGQTAAPSDLPFEMVEKPAEAEKVLPVQEEDKFSLPPFDPKADLKGYKYPSVDLLDDYEDRKTSIDRTELEANKNQIVETLSHYKISIKGIRATIGPTVTLYEIIPTPGTKINKIKNLENDIALSLAALGIRIIAPMPGKGTIGIEVPNKKKSIVAFKEIISTDKFQKAKMALPIAIGKTISNEIFVADLTKMPHLLIAGATGQGKSVGINVILMSLLYKQHPSQVKIVMIDPKKVELYPYSKLDKHFLTFLPDEEEPIITDTSKAIHTLTSLTIEMDNRYDLLKKARVRNIKEYNKKYIERKLNPENGHKYMPYIVLVIDEFADLIMTAGKEIELPIARLAQLARAIGIHLIIATQRPTTNIITGMIKANFPARLSYKVMSLTDSRTILDAKGAEQLVGMGDMLFTAGSELVRLQCAFVDTPEVERVIDHIDEQPCYPRPYLLPEVTEESDISGKGQNLKWSDLDSQFEEAAKLVVSGQHGSTSMIQRKLQLGYNRAGRIMDQMHTLGIVGDTNGSKPREVLFHSEIELAQYIKHLKDQ